MQRTALFREFADLEPTEKGILDFANRFGLLGRGGNFKLETASGPTLARAETLASWQAETKSLRTAIAFWNISSAGGAPTIVRKELQKLNLRLPLMRQLHIDDDDPAMAALSVVQNLTDSRLSQHTRVPKPP
jgi:hypothetical protein